MSKIDPITVALTQNRLDAMTQQMGWVMTRTATSPIFSQSHDFSCFLTTATGAVVAQADGIPIHTGSGGFVVAAILRDFDDIGEGDVFILNDPYLAGGNHLPDWTVVRPTFLDGELIGFACNRAHQADIGGGAAGTYNSASTEIFHEGVRLPVLRLIERGRTREDLWRLLQANTRTPEAMDGDLRAMIGSTRIGAEGIQAIARDLGHGRVRAVFEAILEHAHQRQRLAFLDLPVGTYYGEERSDNDCFELRDVWIKVALTIRADGTAKIDFTGSDSQIKGFKNSSLANTYSAVLVAIAAFFDPDIPRNGGRFRCMEIIAPEGSIVNPRPPAPVTLCTAFCAHDIIHAVWKALAQADPHRACAGWAKNIFGVTAGEGRRGPFVMYHVNAAAGAGAVDGRDGFNSIAHVVTLGGFVIPDVEVSERDYPVQYLRQQFRCDSGGAGKYRGGTGVEYAIRIQQPAQYSFRGEGLRYVSSYGVQGGVAGDQGEMILELSDGTAPPAPKYGVESHGPLTMRALSPGGGGYGDPFERDPERVSRDVRDEVLSAEAAHAVYGVALATDGSVDRAATFSIRAARRDSAAQRT